MPHRVMVGERAVDGRDVAAWLDSRREPADDEEWRGHARAYVDAHPRPATGQAQTQRLCLLRRLAAGPASTVDLLVALREAGWVGASDLENRLREVSGDRGGGTGLTLVATGGRHALSMPFPRLDAEQVRALGFAKAITGRLDGELAEAAARALDDLLPGLAPTARPPAAPSARLGTVQALHAALVDRRVVRLRYDSRNSRMIRAYHVVPVEYAPRREAVKAICVLVDAEGRRLEADRQFALDRVVEVAELDPPVPAPDDVEPRRDPIELVVSEDLLGYLRERDVFGVTACEPEEVAGDVDAYVVRGSFPRALAWDVLEDLCAWSGSVQVRSPLWMVNAVCRRLRAGLAEMEAAAGFDLVKPDPTLSFASHAEAVAWEPEPAAPGPAGRARPLRPPR